MRFGKVRLMTMFGARSVAEAASVQLDESVPFHLDNVSEGGDDGNTGHAGRIWNL